MIIAPEEVFIKALKNRAFCSPSSNISSWSKDLLTTWGDPTATMEEWLHRFQMIANIEDQDPSQLIDLEMTDREAKSHFELSNLQSARKRKRTGEVKLEMIDYTLGCNFSEPQKMVSPSPHSLKQLP